MLGVDVLGLAETVEEDFGSDDFSLPAEAAELQRLMQEHSILSLRLRELAQESQDLQATPMEKWSVFALFFSNSF